MNLVIRPATFSWGHFGFYFRKFQAFLMLSAGLNIRMLPENTSLPYFHVVCFPTARVCPEQKRHCTFSISLWNVKVKLFLPAIQQFSISNKLFFANFPRTFKFFQVTSSFRHYHLSIAWSVTYKYCDVMNLAENLLFLWKLNENRQTKPVNNVIVTQHTIRNCQ